jgi:ATP synthase protein I
MTDRRHDTREDDAGIARSIERDVARKLRSRREGRTGAAFGFGMFGLVGWSVAVPTVAGLALGVWLDGAHPGRASWTLTFLVIGAALGCLNAWYWIRRESR